MIEVRRVRSDAVVTLSDVLSATGRLPAGWASSTESMGFECDLELVQQLTQKAATFLPVDDMDAWLAPRLHAALRLPRRVAGDDGMWAWFAFHCRDYVVARFQKGREKLHPWRYRGVWSRNALSRLWWGAEMTRNGGDYGATELCFRRTRTAQFALELMYSWDRAACIAFCQVAEGADGNARLSDSQMKRLSTRLKVLLTLRSLNAFGEGTEEDSEDFDSAWAGHRPSFGALMASNVLSLPGPTLGTVEAARLRELTEWFRSIADDAEQESAEESGAVAPATA